MKSEWLLFILPATLPMCLLKCVLLQSVTQSLLVLAFTFGSVNYPHSFLYIDQTRDQEISKLSYQHHLLGCIPFISIIQYLCIKSVDQIFFYFCVLCSSTGRLVCSYANTNLSCLLYLHDIIRKFRINIQIVRIQNHKKYEIA